MLATPEKSHATSLSRFSRLGTVRDIPPYRGSPQSDVADHLEASKTDISLTLEPVDIGRYINRSPKTSCSLLVVDIGILIGPQRLPSQLCAIY